MPDSAIQKRSQSLILAYKQLVASEWHWPHQNAAERGSRATHGNKIVAPTLKIRKSQQGASPPSCGLRGQTSNAELEERNPSKARKRDGYAFIRQQTTIISPAFTFVLVFMAFSSREFPNWRVCRRPALLATFLNLGSNAVSFRVEPSPHRRCKLKANPLAGHCSGALWAQRHSGDWR